ncbi:hypothetical protein PV10_05547 [Exophiala mesophila]|uniref:Uncharacterized protein n=1 Tax=Exophiala mesophila TaxID=212818 RepID=A0A0D1ZVZ2_EXOME|nr:uncharacterized protein PV10_05547 [Exophiala mesophila]KIV90948.1 hypothetical protein PV10_05547 [Exophiala mesophila]
MHDQTSTLVLFPCIRTGGKYSRPDHDLVICRHLLGTASHAYPLICRSHVHESGPEPNPGVGPEIRILTFDNQCPLLLSTFLDNYFISHIVDFLLDHHTSVGNPPFMPNILPLVIFGSPNFLKQRYVLAIFLFSHFARTPFLSLIVVQ